MFRPLAVLSAVAVLAALWLGPLLTTDADSFTAHMIAHMGVVAIAAPLLAAGIAGTRFDPLNGHRFAPLAIIASLAELVVVWAWHAPALRALARSSTLATAIEQASFLVVGLILWLSCLGHDGQDRRNAAGVLGLLMTSIHMTLLGVLLALTPRPLYGTAPVTCLGYTLSAGTDQQLGGILMLLIGAAVYLAGGLVLAARLLRGPDSAPHRLQRG
ncbi:cytochrome c oxidase assembly protein [Marinivivus vitaminiproducens]|uniref:cytochrome c oxidase assembly protein n=1 Tax=Marinivivus vitaminiproducens TaxID=3035935 RepID=UPI0027A98CF7|nr:cytochrome c oxidase assembly protein [Geminicoccaceae bacterium SCSIO 64248]